MLWICIYIAWMYFMQNRLLTCNSKLYDPLNVYILFVCTEHPCMRSYCVSFRVPNLKCSRKWGMGSQKGCADEPPPLLWNTKWSTWNHTGDGDVLTLLHRSESGGIRSCREFGRMGHQARSWAWRLNSFLCSGRVKTEASQLLCPFKGFSCHIQPLFHWISTALPGLLSPKEQCTPTRLIVLRICSQRASQHRS